MFYFLDTEFVERPCTIQLISIALVSEDGDVLYAGNIDFNLEEADSWIQENVFPSLPVQQDSTGRWEKDLGAQGADGEPFWQHPNQIAKKIVDFVDDSPEFWGYYADYDWVVFCWLFGRMIDLPSHFPIFCLDLRQECTFPGKGKIKFPPQKKGEHDALQDAHWIRQSWEYLKEHEV